MRKILSYMLVLAVFASIFAMPAGASEKENVLTIEEETLIGLGAIEEDGYNPEAYLTRAGFASIVAQLCNFIPENKAYLDNMQSSFGTDNKDELITAQDRVFEDVDSTMKEYEAIRAMKNKGYMNGITSELFGPYYDITAGEVVKVIVCMLGREEFARYEGGYPAGYMEVARKIKLTSGLDLASSDFITLKETLLLLYNAFDINVYELSSVGDDGSTEYIESDENFLSYCAGICTSEGNMTDNGITTYYGKSDVGRDMMVVHGVKMYISDSDYARDYLGREVIAYYTEDEAGKKYLKYVCPSDADSNTFSADDFVSYTSGQIKYYNDSGKLVNAALSDVNVIYNNTVLDRYSSDTFKFNFGDITLVSTTGGKKYDVIIINDYMVGKIKKISSADKVIYSDTLYKNMNMVKMLDLEESDDKTVIITDENGNRIDFEGLSVGNVISVLKNDDGSYINIRVCQAVVKNFEISNYTSAEELTISDGSSSYVLKGVSDLADKINIKLGELYDLYLDHEGNLIYLEALADSTNLKKAFLVDAAKDSNGFGDTCAVKVYTEDGELKIYELEEKVLLNHASVKSDKAYDEIKSAIGKIVLYRADKDTEILKAIVTPLKFGADDSDDRGWYELIPYIRLSAEKDETKEAFENYHNNDAIDNKFVYETNGSMLDKSYRYNEKIATLFAVPNTKNEYNEEKKFYVNNLTFEGEKGYWLNAYDTDTDAIAPEAIAFSNGGGSASGDKVSERKAFIITKVLSTLNSDEEETKAYKGYLMDADNSAVTETTLAVSAEAVFVNRENKVGAPEVELEAGDIIRFGTNSDGDISAIFVTYDMSKSTAYPFGLNSIDLWYGGDTYGGYVYSTDGDYVRITSEEPHLVPEDAVNQFKYFTDRTKSAVQAMGKKILIVEKSRSGVSVRVGTKDDIVSYRDTGVPPSGSYDKFVGIEYAWGHTLADVIYK